MDSEHNDKLKISVTKLQANIIKDALDIYLRLGIGQFRPALEKLPQKKLFDPLWHEDLLLIGKILSNHMIDNVDGWQRHLSISNKDVDIAAKIAWEMYQVIRNHMAWDAAIKSGIVTDMDSERNWDKMVSNAYDKPYRITSEPMVEITI
jgi:hypothetical protein